jgi:phage FluMu protein Com
MPVIDYIQKYGFRRWYERQLIESHAYLALGFIALIMMLAGVEVMGDMKSSTGYLSILLMAALGGVLMLVAWRRFNALLARAEQFAEAATCPSCKTWGKFRVLGQEATTNDDPPEAGRPRWLRVRCAKCGNEWRLG